MRIGPVEIKFNKRSTQWLQQAFVGGKSNAGVMVNEQTALTNSTVYACVRILSETVASLPLIVYRRLDNGGKDRAVDYYLYSVLHDQPNPEMTSFEWRELMMSHLCLWGNAYSEIVRNGNGQPVELWPLMPNKMMVQRDDTGQLKYLYTLDSGKQVVLDRSQVFHVRGLSGDGIIGYSPIRMAREAIGLAMATEEFGARFFGQGAHMGGIIQHPETLSPDAYENLKHSLQEEYSGLGKTHKVLILEEGAKYEPVGIPPEDSQFLETRNFQVSEIARIFRIPLHLLDGTDKAATYASVEQFALQFVVHTIRPWLVRWEQAIKRDLILPSARNMFFAEFLVDGLLRGDIESRYRAYATGRQWGWLSVDEIRAMENLNPLENGEGKIYLSPSNMQPSTDLTEDTPPEQEPEQEPPTRSYERRQIPEDKQKIAKKRLDTAKRYRTLFEEREGRIVRREAGEIKKAAAKHLLTRDVTTFTAWLDDFYKEHKQYMAEQWDPLMRTYGDEIAAQAYEELGLEGDLDDKLIDFLRQYMESHLAYRVSSAIGQLKQVMREAPPDDILAAVNKRLDEWVATRPGKVAEWETNQAANAVTREVYIANGVRQIQWMAMGETCPYCLDMSGRTVNIQDTFLQANTPYQPEGADTPLMTYVDIKHPPAHAGCDCQIVAG